MAPPSQDSKVLLPNQRAEPDDAVNNEEHGARAQTTDACRSSTCECAPRQSLDERNMTRSGGDPLTKKNNLKLT